MSEDISCEVAGEEAERHFDQLTHHLEHHTSYNRASRGHIAEHLICGLAQYAAELTGQTPRDVLAEAIASASSSEEWHELQRLEPSDWRDDNSHPDDP
jgi:hypothetical protein